MMTAASWATVPVSDVCASIVDCVNKTAPAVEYETPYKMLRTTNVRNGWVSLASVKHVTEETYEKWTRRQVPRRGDIILTREAPLGEVGMLRTDDRVFLGQRLVAYRVDPHIAVPEFILYAMQGPFVQNQIRSLGSGSTVEHMRVPDCGVFQVPLPPLPIQRRIAAILSAYDDLIEVNTRRIAILEETARRVYEEWFVRQADTGWPSVSFDEIAQVLSGGTPKKSEPTFWDGGIPFFTPKDAPSSAYVLETTDSVTEAGLSKCAGKLYPRDTTFITARGTVGRVHLASRPMAMNQSCYALAGQEGVPPLFLYQATLASVRELRARAHGAVFDTVTKETFSLLSVAMPPKDLMARYEAEARPIMDLALNLQRQVRNLRAQRALLLPRLVSGKLSVDEAERQAEKTAA